MTLPTLDDLRAGRVTLLPLHHERRCGYCPRLPCGAVDATHVDPDCPEHSAKHGRAQVMHHADSPTCRSQAAKETTMPTKPPTGALTAVLDRLPPLERVPAATAAAWEQRRAEDRDRITELCHEVTRLRAEREQLTPAPTWEDVWAAIGREVWKLAPQDFQDSAHRDLKFLTNWQDIMWAVQNGIVAVAALPDEDQP